jgi:hypothetical protein
MKKVASRLGSPIREAEDPRFAGGNSLSPIPGTPPDLQVVPEEEKRKQKREKTESELMRSWMGHTQN